MDDERAGRDEQSTVDEDGTLHVAPFTLPPSPAWSPTAARRVYLRRFTSNPVAGVGRGGDAPDGEERWMADQRAYRSGMEFLHRRLLERIRADHDVEIEETAIGGVRVEIVTPTGGTADPSRVLVNLHGGAFVGGAESCGLVESCSIATTGRYRIVVVDYRQGWEHRFPAASEDVEAVYRALLIDHDPSSVGIFGYSAGATLTAQSMAWFDAVGLPVPGAIAICSGSAGLDGDSSVLATVAMGDRPPPPRDPTEPARFGYLEGVDPSDPLVSPGLHAEVLATFPPSLILTGTRSFDLSGAVRTHRALLAAGASSELHVFEGMWHCFPYHHHLAESDEAYGQITSFFDRTLGAGG